MEASLVCGELIGNLLRSLNDPKVEVLCLYDEIVTIAYLLLYLLDLVAGEAWYDTVHKSGINTT